MVNYFSKHFPRETRVDMNDMRLLLERLWDRIVTTEAVKWGDFVLASGMKSPYYFEGKRVAGDPEGIHLIASLVWNLIADTDIEAVGGLEVGSVPIATSIAHLSHITSRRQVSAFWVRKEAKGHGTKRLIEGLLPPVQGARVAIVDDVVTRGGSVQKAIDAVEEAGHVVGKVVVLVDRHQGGGEELRNRGYDFAAIYGANEHGQFRIEYPGEPSIFLGSGLARVG